MEQSEKRQYKRIASNVVVKYKKSDSKSSLPYSNYTENISAGGVCFYSNVEFKKNDLLSLEFKLKEKDLIIGAKATVVWVEKDKSINRFLIGVRFNTFSDVEIQFFDKVLTEVEKSNNS